MRSFALAATLLASVSARAEVDLPGFDAFLNETTQRAIDVDALPASVRDRVKSGRVSAVEPRLGVPTFFWAERDARSLRDTGITSEEAARRHLFAYAELYRFAPAVLAKARLYRLHDVGSGPIVAAFKADVSGTHVFNDELKVVMNRDYGLIAFSGYLSPARKVLGDFAVASDTAIGLGFFELTGEKLGSELARLPTDEAGFERVQLEGQGSPVRFRRVYYPTTKGLEPAWHLELEVSAEESTTSDHFAFVYSARDGRLLYRKNLTVSDFSYRVWADATGLKAPFDGPNGNDPSPHPTGTNNGYSPPFVAPNLVSVDTSLISTNDPWLAANATTTDGNNIVAYADFNSPNGFSSGDLKATTTAAGVFDRTYDVALAPNASANQRMAAVTQLFYDNNFFHDWYYDVGFDEASGNAQKTNFGRGGAGNDPLLAEAQDYSGTNNANMSTPSDGYSPRMQMYIFTTASPATFQIQGSNPMSTGLADFGPQSFTVTGQVVLVNDGDTTGSGTTAGTVTDGCQMTWSSNVTGKIAAIDRGVCTFAEKVANAQANGAIGVVIMNNTGNNSVPPMPGDGPSITIPALSISRTNGNTLKSRIAAGTTTATMTRSAAMGRDGTIENGIVAHEWGHYISNRLIGDGTGIANNQGVGMGEGWSDFHALLMSVKGEDAQVPSNASFNGTYAMAGYTSMLTGPNGFYWGIRRMPYSTNLMKNPLTFKHIQANVPLPTGIPMAFGQNGRSNAEVHATGEVWAVMLWECYASLLRDSARLTFEQARDRMRAYLVASYKITALNPTFVEARDAMLAAAVAGDPTDFALFSAAFAKRGLGMLAVAPSKGSTTNTPVTESFMNGNAFEIVSVALDDSVNGCDRDGYLDTGETGRLTVTVKNVGIGLLSATTGTVRTTAAGVTLSNGGALSFGNIPPFGTATASVEVSLGASPGNAAASFEVELNDPTLVTPGPVRLTVPMRLNFDAKTTGSLSDDVEAPMTVWSYGNNPNLATGMDFRVYSESATEHWFYGPNPQTPSDTYLVSPWLDVGAGPFSFSFSHRFQFEGEEGEWYDGGVIEISDGGAWVDLGAFLSQPYNGQLANAGSNPLRGRALYSGQSENYPAFSTVTAELGTAYANRRVRIRFRIGADDALGLKGWEIDDLQFMGITNRPFPSVVTDPNVCSNGVPVVTAPAPRSVIEGTRVTLAVTAVDPDNEPLTVTFTQVSGPAVVMEGAEFTAPQVDADTLIELEIIASDGRAQSAPVMQQVLVRNVNKTPVVTLTPAEQTVDELTAVTITGAAVDGDNEPVAGWRWVQRSGPAVGLTGLDTATLTFTAPEVAADTVLTFELYARDALSEGAPAIATVTVRNLGSQAPTPLGPVVEPPKCGCSSGNEGLTTWLAAAIALFVVLSRKRQW
ncbi:MAG: myxosortase-dependent M36 family metallopeptidase [Myxococcaceae bacterium]|nr:myxosortase-dependent M36 family metallopeptidase [Myxococcaceae bacterium]